MKPRVAAVTAIAALSLLAAACGGPKHPGPDPSIHIRAELPPSADTWPHYPAFPASSCWTRPFGGGRPRLEAAPSGGRTEPDAAGGEGARPPAGNALRRPPFRQAHRDRFATSDHAAAPARLLRRRAAAGRRGLGVRRGAQPEAGKRPDDRAVGGGPRRRRAARRLLRRRRRAARRVDDRPRWDRAVGSHPGARAAVPEPVAGCVPGARLSRRPALRLRNWPTAPAASAPARAAPRPYRSRPDGVRARHPGDHAAPRSGLQCSVGERGHVRGLLLRGGSTRAVRSSASRTSTAARARAGSGRGTAASTRTRTRNRPARGPARESARRARRPAAPPARAGAARTARAADGPRAPAAAARRRAGRSRKAAGARSSARCTRRCRCRRSRRPRARPAR